MTTNLTTTQEQAIKCAFVDLCASYKAWYEMDVYSHDWTAHINTIDEMMAAFPFLEDTKKQLNIYVGDENEEDEDEKHSFKLVPISGGTCRQGHINTTYSELVKVFGEPNCVGDGGFKVSIEWSIEFSDGTTATIYDWKLSESERSDVRRGVRKYQFHIGGFNSNAVARVHEAMGMALV